MNLSEEVRFWHQHYLKLIDEIQEVFDRYPKDHIFPPKPPSDILQIARKWGAVDNVFTSWFNSLFQTKINPPRILRDPRYLERLKSEFRSGAPLNLILMLVAENKILNEEILSIQKFNSLFRKYQQRVELLFRSLDSLEISYQPLYQVELPQNAKLLNYSDYSAHQSGLNQPYVSWSIYGTPDNSNVIQIAEILGDAHQLLKQAGFSFLFKNRIFRIVMHDAQHDPFKNFAAYAQPVAPGKTHATPATQEFSIDILESLPRIVEAIRLSGQIQRPSDIVRTIIHELGHALYWEVLSHRQRMAYQHSFDQAMRDPETVFSTQYSQTDARENFAETFSILIVKDRQLSSDDYQKFVDVMQMSSRTAKLLETTRRNPSVQIRLKMDKYIKEITDYIRELDIEDPEDTAKIFIEKTQQHQEARVKILEEAISRISPWNNSTLTIEPHYFAKSWRGYSAYSSDPFEPVLSSHIQVAGKLPEGYQEHPGFTWFADNEIDDVIDVGDPDFFMDPKVQSDYFALIRELRAPGSTQQQGKVMTLYTARPVADRAKYLSAGTVPVGIFLANSPSHVAGLAIDLADSDAVRDVYKIRIYQKYILLSQDLGNIKYYQTIGDAEVPVLSINLY